MSEDRILYTEILQRIIEENSSFSKIKNEVNGNNLAFCNMLIMTTFRNLNFIKKQILPIFVKKKIKQKILTYILYLATTEILFMNTPDYAVVNSYVDIAKKKTDRFGANFINAVLRNILRKKDELLKLDMSHYFSQEFLKILRLDYSDKEISKMENFVNTEPPIDITLKHNVNPADYDGHILPCGSVRFPANTKVLDIPGFNDGKWWVQDAGASLAVRFLKNIENKKVLDICAAPGGKTAQLLDMGANVTAVDVSQERLETLSENMKRLKFSEKLKVICADALNFETTEQYDVILLDAPCSATGTFRRHPEIIHTKSIQDIKKQASLQKNILHHIQNFVAPNGIILYVTCSLSKLEGEKQVIDFINTHPNFKIIKINDLGTSEMQTKEGFLRILPHHYARYSGIDGFFIAAMQRII